MMNNIKIRVWNINGRSGRKRNNKAYVLPSFIAAEIMNSISNERTADIIVLTEFVLTNGWEKLKFDLELYGYSLFFTQATGENGILIALKKNAGLSLESAVSTSVMNTKKAKRPNFLQVTVNYMGDPLTIIGTRIRHKETTRKDFLNRREQLEALVEHLGEIENFVVGGDFNNAKINGNCTQKYPEVREKYRYTYKGEINVSYDTYNYHILKDRIEECGFCLYTPIGNVTSWGTHFKLDHIITSKNIGVCNLEYNWSFKNKKYGYEECKDILPDHAILSAEINTNLV